MAKHFNIDHADQKLHQLLLRGRSNVLIRGQLAKPAGTHACKAALHNFLLQLLDFNNNNAILFL